MSRCYRGIKFRTTAIYEYGYYTHFGIVPKLRNIYGIQNAIPIYYVMFEVADVMPSYPENPDKIEYYGYWLEGVYSLIQHNVHLFATQFPFNIFNCDELKTANFKGKIVRLRLLHSKTKRYPEFRRSKKA